MIITNQLYRLLRDVRIFADVAKNHVATIIPRNTLVKVRYHDSCVVNLEVIGGGQDGTEFNTTPDAI